VVISIDTLYFSDNYAATLAVWKAALRPGGRLAIFFSHGPGPDVPWDLTSADYELAQRRQAVLADLKPQFEAEGNLFIYENRMGDALGFQRAIEAGRHARYLYLGQWAVPT
jgi:hypothetical protein